MIRLAGRRAERSGRPAAPPRRRGFPAAVRALGLVLASIAVAAAAAAADVRVVGTDLLGLEFSKALYAFAGRAGVSVALAFDGSRPGLDELKAGGAQAGLLVFAPGEEAGAAGFERVPLAYHRALVIVPAALPLEQLTFAQLDGIFGAGGLTRWGQLGLDGEWTNSIIAPQVPAVGAGLAAEIFRHGALRDRAFKLNVGRFDSPDELALRLSGDSRVVAVVAAPPPAAFNARIVAVAAQTGEPAFLPTLENVHSGDYPLRLPLWLVFRREQTAAVLPLLRFLLSDEAVPLFERAQLAPLPSGARRQQVLAAEKR